MALTVAMRLTDEHRDRVWIDKDSDIWRPALDGWQVEHTDEHLHITARGKPTIEHGPYTEVGLSSA